MKAYTIAPDGSHHNTSTYTYKRGLLRSIDRKDGINEYLTEYTYKAGKEVSVITYHNEVETSKTLRDYGEDYVKVIMYAQGELYSQSIEKTDGNIELIEMTTYPDEIVRNMQVTLDENDNPIHYWMNDGEVIQEALNTYDEANNLIHSISKRGEETNEMSYAYDEYGNIISRTTLDMTTTYEYVYDDSGEFIEKKTYRDGQLTNCITREVTYGK